MEDQGAVFESCEELLGGGVEEGWKALESTSKEGDYCSIERMQVSTEEGNPARLELREKTRVNERTFATAKKMHTQDDKVDAAEVGELAKFIRERGQDEVHSEEENALLEEIAEICIYFQRLVTLKEFGVKDGIALAHDLLWTAFSAKKRVERLEEVVEKSRTLKELCLRHS
ncbi:hypothetical protein TrLO_g13641 [Triparma laevis f. longispina]|uniref:Uncharacterized protein n=1 Tax=Triparma laevis f. longispina TaxID=1714387 RepID=A0A9W7DY70_9STRA|nr:hypothetical protein TrLO_g13641 [Triparma laevis f. longispina]